MFDKIGAMRSTVRLIGLGVLSSIAVACSDEVAPSPAAGNACVPDRAQWDSTVRAHVERQCGACHGATPAYGAPSSLLDYDANLRPRNGARPVDRIAARLMDGTMPPAGTPAPNDDVSRAIVQWASCGAQTPPAGRGLRASRAVFRSPEVAPAGTEMWELRAGNFAVGPTEVDRYQCFTFTYGGAEPRFVRRFEFLGDRREVVHHVVLLRDNQMAAPTTPFVCNNMPEGSDYLYAWAPGQDALQFPEGGLRIVPGQRLVMQIHYNNGQALPNVVDNSGLRLYHAAPGGTEYGMVAIGPLAFQVPARSTVTAQSGCNITRESRLLTGMPHMHGWGSAFTQDIVRQGGARESLIALQGWRFETELFYDFSTALHPGDRIETQCTFNNTSADMVRSGSRTSDEMCFNFAYVTPPPAERYCDQATGPADELAYAPGACAMPAAPTMVPTATGRAMVGAPPALAGGALPDARWELTGVSWYLSAGAVGPSMINLDETTLAARGQVWTSAGRFNADFITRLGLVLTGGARIARDIPGSFAGTYTGAAASPLTLAPACPSTATMPTVINYAVEGDTLTVGVPSSNFSGLTISPRYTFRRAP
jgi:cytochrome c5